MAENDFSVRAVLNAKMVETGLFQVEQANELTGRIADDEKAMLTLLGRLTLEAARGGTKAEQGVRALLNADVVPRALDTFNALAMHELADESFPLIAPDQGQGG